MPNASDATSWKVTGQLETTRVQQTGPPVQGMQVFYQTGKGHSGSVFVPQSQYNAHNVRALVAAAAANMDAVGMLSAGQA